MGGCQRCFHSTIILSLLFCMTAEMVGIAKACVLGVHRLIGVVLTVGLVTQEILRVFGRWW